MKKYLLIISVFLITRSIKLEGMEAPVKQAAACKLEVSASSQFPTLFQLCGLALVKQCTLSGQKVSEKVYGDCKSNLVSYFRNRPVECQLECQLCEQLVHKQLFKQPDYHICWSQNNKYCIISTPEEGVILVDAINNRVVPLNNNDLARFPVSEKALLGFGVKSIDSVVKVAWWMPNSEQLKTIGRDGYIRSLNITTDRFIEEHGRIGWSDLQTCFNSNDSLKLVTVDYNGEAQLFNLEKKCSKSIYKRKQHKKEVTKVFWSPTSTVCALLIDNNCVRLVEVAKGKPLGKDIVHPEYIIDCIWDGAGHNLVVLSRSMMTAIPVKNLQPSQKEIPYSTISLEPFRALAACWDIKDELVGVETVDKELLLVNVNNKKVNKVENISDQEPAILQLNAQLKNAVALRGQRRYKELFSPDGTKVACIEGSELKLKDVCSSLPVATFSFDGMAHAWQWSPDSTKIAIVVQTQAIIFDVTIKRVIATVSHSKSIRKIAWSPDSTKLISLSASEIHLLPIIKLTDDQYLALLQISFLQDLYKKIYVKEKGIEHMNLGVLKLLHKDLWNFLKRELLKKDIKKIEVTWAPT